MSKHKIYERIIHKFDEITSRFLLNLRKNMINNDDFTIISNNCWGGKVYEFFKLQKQSPTIGSYFFAEDYIKFLYNFEYYINQKIEIITASQSKHYKRLKEKGQDNVPIGKLDDIEIIFLHYKDPRIAKEKFERRIKRINMGNLIFKFSYMNDCTEEFLEKFDRIEGIKKIMFVGKKNRKYKDSIIIPTGKSGQIEDDTYNWRKYVNIYKLINSKKTSIDELRIRK